MRWSSTGLGLSAGFASSKLCDFWQIQNFLRAYFSHSGKGIIPASQGEKDLMKWCITALSTGPRV